MDAVEFAKAQRRMCKTYSCNGCPLKDVRCRIGVSDDASDDERIISIVETWAKTHPVKTRQSEFLKLHPNAARRNGLLDICPKNIDTNFKCPFVDVLDCYECKDIYWSKEVE